MPRGLLSFLFLWKRNTWSTIIIWVNSRPCKHPGLIVEWAGPVHDPSFLAANTCINNENNESWAILTVDFSPTSCGQALEPCPGPGCISEVADILLQHNQELTSAKEDLKN